MIKKKIGLLIDTSVVSKQVFDLINISYKSDSYEITTLIINNVERYPGNLIEKVFKYIKLRGLNKFISLISFKLICKTESLIIRKNKRFEKFYKNYKLSKTDFEIINVFPIVSKSGLIFKYSKKDLYKIKEANLNLIVRSGGGILSGPILESCPNGIISFHHGDNNINRGGPAGFWEVFHGFPKTGFIIQRLKEELDGGDVLYKGFISTSWFYSLNLARLYEISNHSLKLILDKITSENPNIKVHEKVPYCGPLYTTPNSFEITLYLIKTLFRLSKKVARQLSGKRNSWGVAYQFTESWEDVVLRKSIKIPNPLNRYLADPFVIKRDGIHYCFVEDYDYKIRRGGISVYQIKEDNCIFLGSALKEDFHLSYPFLFKYKNDLFMCPESHNKRSIRIYRCIEFPLKWEFYKTIMKDICAVDTNIFFQQDKWWLISNIDKTIINDYESQLHIFYSDNPLSENWTPHKNNPVIFDSQKARNGGFISDKSGNYRVFQSQGFDLYGESSGISKIESITSEVYTEKDLFKISPNFFPNIKGSHTYNYSEGLLVFDFLE